MSQIELNFVLMVNWIAGDRTILTFTLHTFAKVTCLKWNCFEILLLHVCYVEFFQMITVYLSKNGFNLNQHMCHKTKTKIQTNNKLSESNSNVFWPLKKDPVMTDAHKKYLH